MPVNKVIYATIGDMCICLNESMNTPTLFCKQKEADTRIFLHCKLASARFREVIIHTSFTDVFVLVLGFARSLNYELFIKTGLKDKNRIISISRIIDKLKGTYGFQEREIIIQSIIEFHAFTGCDTISAFWRKRKVHPLHIMLKNPEFMMTFAELGNNWEIDKISLLSKIEVFACAVYGCISCNSVNKLRYASILQF